MIRRHRLPAWRLHAVRGKPVRVCLLTPYVNTAPCATGRGLEISSVPPAAVNLPSGSAVWLFTSWRGLE